ncbi:MAG TPA: histidine--tRNA ligase [Pseudonocardiaceae bacterium]
MAVQLRGVNGMHDVLPDTRVAQYRRSHHWTRLLNLFWRTAETYDFDFVDTPEVEQLDLFVRGVGESSDIVSKEMYTWRQGERDLCLRPEGSAAVARAVIMADATHQGPLRVWYRMPMFRHERPQFGRYRRHVQHGAEIIGVDGATADVEVIKLLLDYLGGAGLTGFSLHLNSIGDGVCRPAYVEELRSLLRPRAAEYCADCQRRIEVNPLRVFDCKVPADRERNAGLPRIVDRLCEPCATHFSEVRAGLDAIGIGYVLDPELVRGLDYYTRTAFEVILDEPVEQMATVTGGGRYDGLYEALGGRPTAAVGFGAGVERLLLALEHQGALPAARPGPVAFVVATDAELVREVYPVVDRLRSAGLATAYDQRHRRFPKAVGAASDRGSRYAVLLAPKEWDAGELVVKDLTTGEQRTVAATDIAKVLAG